MSQHSLKKELIARYSSLTDIDELKDNRILIVTSFGILSGKLAPSESDDLSIKIFLEANKAIVKKYREDHSLINQPIPGNDGFIPLIDVDLLNSVPSVHFNFLNVFFDQIIGITIGNSKFE